MKGVPLFLSSRETGLGFKVLAVGFITAGWIAAPGAGAVSADLSTRTDNSVDSLISKAASANPGIIPGNSTAASLDEISASVISIASAEAVSTSQAVKIAISDGKTSSTRAGTSSQSLISKLEKGQTEAKFAVTLPADLRMVTVADGSIELIDSQGVASGTRIAAPWATDSTGKNSRQDTWYLAMRLRKA